MACILLKINSNNEAAEVSKLKMAKGNFPLVIDLIGHIRSRVNMTLCFWH